MRAYLGTRETADLILAPFRTVGRMWLLQGLLVEGWADMHRARFYKAQQRVASPG
jgi:hypothetical protein